VVDAAEVAFLILPAEAVGFGSLRDGRRRADIRCGCGEIRDAVMRRPMSCGRTGSSKHRAHRIPVTVRIRAVILGPSTGGRGPANASPRQIVGEVIIQHGSAKLIATSRARCEEH
jgi:hypothetical protein